MHYKPFGILVSTALVGYACSASAAVIVTTAKFGTLADLTPEPTISANDLGQIGTFTSTGSEGANPQRLNNGSIGNTDGDTNEEVRINSTTTSVTLTFDVTTNTLGYDITGIKTVAGWNELSGGRSNQGYAITFTFVNDTTATFVNKQNWEPNLSDSFYWTEVEFTEDGGGVLNSDTVAVNGGAAAADAGTTATGVKAISWTTFDNANPGSIVLYREFDVFGTATVPEPSVAILGGIGLLALLRRRR
ncbi:MAG: hypothetical protein NWT08_02190 [Akkermansiaceae bacterium]|jgi:hypothetical protein|nr:hypothetical protein [Akkermansiaceae bacterium]MDP4647476.1 hypothetical protein [Akkermansiaceae bacterium]MDP4722552.1 hypothetical protein [Akkermansiaceae bacterium]MDP4779281.1 hypothetical protein [Akkermansiaceae bacterium]MDP4845968.1 hypothetical protein [Akkermansiaceae bacterium]